jgi:alpha,alpha-trehalase
MVNETPASLYGALFARVQECGILADGKTFVDAVPRRPAAAILADFAALDPCDAALRQFLTANFELPAAVDPFVPGPRKRPLRAHIRAMWPALARDAVVPPADSSALAIGHRHVVPGGRFRELYYWDSYFTMLGLMRDGQHDLASDLVDAMTDLIERYGYMPNGTRSYYCGRSQPPVYYLMVALLDDRRSHIAARRLAAMKREYGWWMAGERDLPRGAQASRVARLADDSLLNRYWDPQTTPRDESWREDVATARESVRDAADVHRDLRAGAESGWDFSSRWLGGNTLSSIRTTAIAPVDLNALLYGLECAIAASDDADGPSYRTRADRRRVAMSTHLWNADVGYFADYDLEANRVRSQPTAAMLAPLFVGLATEQQARTTAHFTRNALLAPGGLRTTLVDSGEQWDSPNGWAPLQWIAVTGLRHYGHDRLAQEIAERWIATVDATYRDTGLLYEKYDVENATIGRGGEYVAQIGFGWTNGVTAALIDQIWSAPSADTSPVSPASPASLNINGRS